MKGSDVVQAARFHDWGQDPQVEDVAPPDREAGDVLVRMQAAALSHLDLTVASGTFGIRPSLPYIAGVEGSGLVVEADDLSAGTQVLVRGAGVGLTRAGTWAELVAVPRRAVWTLPEWLAPEVAATFYQPTSTAHVVVHDIARLQPGERVIVVGAAGAVGSQVVQQALRLGVDVVAVVWRAEEVERLPEGVEVVQLSDEAATARLAEARGASALVDTVGGAQLTARARWVQPGGRAVVVGYTAGTAVTLDLSSWLLDDVAFVPVNMIRQERRARELYGELVGRLARGELRLDVETFDITDIAEALQLLRAGRVRGRAVVTFG